MLKDIDFPDSLRGPALDEYLARGWYRMGQAIFTTDFIPALSGPSTTKLDSGKEETSADPQPDYYRVTWLRFNLDKFSFGKRQQQLMARNRAFSVTIKPFKDSREIESLYCLYRAQVDFEVSPTLRESLFSLNLSPDPAHNVFDTWMIRVRDKRKLVAVGIFDKGLDSIAGIINFYHPGYRKYSLGKWLMLLKIKYALENGIKLYYPGYISPDYGKFDYKLFPGKAAAELFDPSGESWSHYYSFS